MAIPLARWLFDHDLAKGSGLTLGWVHGRGPDAPCRHERDLEPGAATPGGDPTMEGLEKRA